MYYKAQKYLWHSRFCDILGERVRPEAVEHKLLHYGLRDHVQVPDGLPHTKACAQLGPDERPRIQACACAEGTSHGYNTP